MKFPDGIIGAGYELKVQEFSNEADVQRKCQTNPTAFAESGELTEGKNGLCTFQDIVQ